MWFIDEDLSGEVEWGKQKGAEEGAKQGHGLHWSLALSWEFFILWEFLKHHWVVPLWDMELAFLPPYQFIIGYEVLPGVLEA